MGNLGRLLGWPGPYYSIRCSETNTAQLLWCSMLQASIPTLSNRIACGAYQSIELVVSCPWFQRGWRNGLRYLAFSFQDLRQNNGRSHLLSNLLDPVPTNVRCQSITVKPFEAASRWSLAYPWMGCGSEANLHSQCPRGSHANFPMANQNAAGKRTVNADLATT